MRYFRSSILVAAFVAALPMTGMSQVVISQAYGGGGGSTGTYKKDYVELLNLGTTAASLDGWSLQYGSSAGNLGTSAGNWIPFPTGITIQPKHYYLVECGAVGTAGADLSPAADMTTTSVSMSAASGKIALCNVNYSLGAVTIPDPRIVDFVGWGAANQSEGGTTVNSGVALTSVQVCVRKNRGQQDTNNNGADFSVLASGGANAPRNSSSAAVPVTLSGMSID